MFQVTSTREKKLQTDDCAKLTRHLLVTLPKLLSKVAPAITWFLTNLENGRFWTLALMVFYWQFSSCCDAVASLMKIPQYFLPERINTENAQVCFSAPAYKLQHRSQIQRMFQSVASSCRVGAGWRICLLLPLLCSSQAVSSLVAEMATALELHSSSAVLEAAARTFLALGEEGAAWCSVAQATRDSLVQRWADQLRLLLEDSLVVRLPD